MFTLENIIEQFLHFIGFDVQFFQYFTVHIKSLEVIYLFLSLSMWCVDQIHKNQPEQCAGDKKDSNWGHVK